MAKRMGRLKDRFLSKLRRPFHYKKVQKDRDGLDRSVINSSECGKTHNETTTKKTAIYNCLKADHKSRNNNSDSPCFKRGLLSVEEIEVEDSNERRKSETVEEEELTQMKPLPTQTRRRSSAFQKLINWVKPEKRRHAICEQMEREIETRGVSLRQYRKFLATTYILYDLKLL